MANPCIYTYKGKDYTFDELATLFHNGELHDLSTKGIIQGDFLKSMPEELKIVRNEGKENGIANANGNVSVGNGNVAESGIAKQENIEPKSVSESVNVGTSEKSNEVKKVKSVNGSIYDVHFDKNGNIEKIISNKDGREIKQFIEKDGKLRKNPNYSQIEADATGSITSYKAKTEERNNINKAVSEFTPTNEYEVALKALADGLKVNRESISKELGHNDNTKWATSKDGQSIERLAEDLASENPNLDEKGIRDAIIDVIGSHSTISEVKNYVYEKHNENSKKLQEQEARAFLNSLSEKDLAMYESIKAEEEYLSELSDKEIEDYYNQKIKEYEQATTETTNEKSNNTTSSNEKTSGAEEKIVDENGNEYTSLKKAVYDVERESKGKEVINTTNTKTPTQVREEVEAKIKSGEITETEIRDLASAIVQDQNIVTKMTGEELQYALLHDKVTIEKEGRKIDAELQEAIESKDYEKQTELLVKKAQNELLADDNYIASKKTGSEASRILNAKKAGLDEDYSYRAILERVQEKAKDKTLPQEVKDNLKNISDNIVDLQAKIDEYEKRFKEHEAEVEKLNAEKAELEEKISKTKGEEKLEKLKSITAKKEYRKSNIEAKKKATIEQIREKYKRLSGTLNAGVNLKLLELAPEITSLAKLYVEEGVVELEDLLGKMLVELQDVIPDLTERDLRDVFSGYGKTKKPNPDENANTLSQLKSKARALSGLEDVKDLGIAPAKSGVTHRPPTPEVLAIRKEILKEMRERGIDISNSKNPEDVWKTQLQSYKTKINNNIEYLENIKRTKDIDKYLAEKKKTKLKLDDEARQLKKKQQQYKNQVNDLVAKHDFETWSNYRKALHYSGRYAKGVLISSPVTLVKIIGSVGWRLTYKPLHATSMYGMSKIFPKLAETQGISSRKDLADHLVDYYKTAFSKENFSEFVKTFKQHASTEDILFGKHYSNVPLPKIKGNKDLNVAQKLFFGHLKFLEDINASSHGAMKNLVSLPEYKAWKETILRNLIKNGIPAELLENGTAEQVAHQLAFLKGQRARFMQKNIIAEQQTALEARLRNKGLHGTAEAINFVLPIVKIGSNFVGESLEKQPGLGLIPNGANLFKARESLSEKQKSDLLRTLSYQGVGMASFLMGCYMYQNVSPFYGTQAHQFAKKNGKDLPEEDETLGFLKGAYTHAPDAVNMRAGATFMWYWDMYDKANPSDNSMMKFMASLFNREILTGIVSESPYITASEGTIGPILNSKSDLGKAEANFVRGRFPFGDFTRTIARGEIPVLNKIMPETGKELAKKIGMNPEEEKPVKVKGFKNNIAVGIPGWRESVLEDIKTEEIDSKQSKYSEEYNLPESEKIAKSKQDKVKEYESEIKKYEGFIKFIKENPDKPYYVSPSERWTKEDVSIKQAEKAIEEYKKGIKELSK